MLSIDSCRKRSGSVFRRPSHEPFQCLCASKGAAVRVAGVCVAAIDSDWRRLHFGMADELLAGLAALRRQSWTSRRETISSTRARTVAWWEWAAREELAPATTAFEAGLTMRVTFIAL